MLLSIDTRSNNLLPNENINEPLIKYIKSLFRMDPITNMGIPYNICDCTFACFIISNNDIL